MGDGEIRRFNSVRELTGDLRDLVFERTQMALKMRSQRRSILYNSIVLTLQERGVGEVIISAYLRVDGPPSDPSKNLNLSELIIILRISDHLNPGDPEGKKNDKVVNLLVDENIKVVLHAGEDLDWADLSRSKRKKLITESKIKDVLISQKNYQNLVEEGMHKIIAFVDLSVDARGE